MSNKTKFDKEVLCCGDEYVAVKIIENGDKNMKIGNIYVPDSYEANGRLAFAQITKVGSKAAEEYGLSEGDYVFIDFLATFAHTEPVATLKYNNIIYKTNADQSEYFPLKGMVFVEPDSKNGPENVGGVFLLNNTNKLHLGTIVATNLEDRSPFKTGDRVILSKGADHVAIGDKEVCIYKEDMLVATIKE